MSQRRYLGIFRKVLAAVAVLFGVITVFAGVRVITGTNPGYAVFLPLLLYNTLMGFAYMAGGVYAWRSLDTGKKWALAIFLLNLVVLAGIGLWYQAGGAVAVDSLRAMTLRTAVWLVIFAGLWWLRRRNPNSIF